MKTRTHTVHRRSRVFAAALALMLLFGIGSPAASAESYLATHKDEIADAIVSVRSNLATLEEDLAAIRDAVQEREAARQTGQSEGGAQSDPAPEPATRDVPTEPQAPAGEGGEGSGDGSGSSGLTQGGLVDVGVSDLQNVNADVSVKHDITVNVDTSRFNNNTIIRIRETSAARSPVTPNESWTTTAPKTGDQNKLVLWIVIVAVSALALAAALFFLLRKNRKKK